MRTITKTLCVALIALSLPAATSFAATRVAAYGKPEGHTSAQVASYGRPEGHTAPQIASYIGPERSTLSNGAIYTA